MTDFDNDPYQSPPHTPGMYPTGNNQGPGLITAVAVMNYVFGGLSLACGVCTGVLGGSVLGVLLTAMSNDPQVEPGAKLGMGIASAVIIVITVIQLLVGLLIVLAGYGVQNYRQWGRILTIVLAVISALLGVAGLLQLNPFSFVQLAYAIFALIVMLNPEYTKDFR